MFFQHQVAGHKDQLVLHPVYSDRLIKTCNTIEIDFYKAIMSLDELWKLELKPFLVHFYEADDRTMTIENAVNGYTKPCIIDVKLGRILYDELASSEKQERMEKVAQETTSGSLGLRICGMKVFVLKIFIENLFILTNIDI